MGKSVGIMLYFDNFHRVEGLPDAQLGLLFRALMACGEAEFQGRDGIAGFEERFPGLGERAQMAFLFMADNIRRDADAYRARSANLRDAARRREDRKRSAGALEAPQPPEETAPIVPAPAAVRAQLEALTRGIRADKSEKIIDKR